MTREIQFAPGRGSFSLRGLALTRPHFQAKDLIVDPARNPDILKSRCYGLARTNKPGRFAAVFFPDDVPCLLIGSHDNFSIDEPYSLKGVRLDRGVLNFRGGARQSLVLQEKDGRLGIRTRPMVNPNALGAEAIFEGVKSGFSAQLPELTLRDVIANVIYFSASRLLEHNIPLFGNPETTCWHISPVPLGSIKLPDGRFVNVYRKSDGADNFTASEKFEVRIEGDDHYLSVRSRAKGRLEDSKFVMGFKRHEQVIDHATGDLDPADYRSDPEGHHKVLKYPVEGGFVVFNGAYESYGLKLHFEPA
jgi:hypothetical protein